MDTLLIVFLTLLNGAFAMSEMALAASKKARLQALAEAGDKGAAAALDLMDRPTQFLSSVQVGITSIGMLNGIVGEAAFSDSLAGVFEVWGWSGRSAEVSATALVVVVITFVTIVFGELVPKRIGQLYPEVVARRMARPMNWVARGARPFVALLSVTTSGVLRLLRINTNAVQHVTEEEIAASLEQGVDAGIIEAHEHQMVRNVFLLDDRQLGSIMVPRADVKWLEASDNVADALQTAWQWGHSWYPVCRGGLDDVVGIIHVAQLMQVHAQQGQVSGQEPTPLANHVQTAVFVPETLSGMELLEQFRVQAMRMVFVVDEYGVVQGLLTPLDLLEAITGELQPETAVDAWATPQADGSWRVDGAMPAQELKARLDLVELPDEDKGRYNTVAGLMQTVAGDLLASGDTVDWGGWRFEVEAMDGRRIDRVLIRREPGAHPDGEQTASP
jgi:putative hemolysin